MKNAQAANEAAIIIGFMTLFLIIFLGAISDKLISATDVRTRALADDLADVIESELILAANAEDGYSRTFTLAPLLDGKAYLIEFYNRSNTNANFTQLVITVNVTGGEHSAVKVLPDNIIGTIATGDNLLRKQDGIVNVSSSN